MKRYGATTWPRPTAPPEVLPPGAELTSETPSRPASLHADLLVPMAQAAVTGGLLAGIIVMGLAELAPDLPINPVKAWGAAALVIASVAWLLLLTDTRRLLWAVERLVNADIDQDGQAGPPERRTLRVEVTNGQTMQFIDADLLEIGDDRLLLFAAGVTGGRGLTEGDWGGDRAAFPEGMNQWRSFRGRLLDAGLIRYKNPKVASLGYELTPAGRAVFGRLAQHSHTHTHGGGA